MAERPLSPHRSAMIEFAIFDSAIGHCGIAWSGRGVVVVQLPQQTEQKTRERVKRRLPEAREGKPSAIIQQAIEDIVTLLNGERRDLADVLIDDERIPPFNRRVYAIARTIPPGATMTYGQIAERLGDLALSRDVGRALGSNPTPIIMPCHRVLAAEGKTGGFSAPGGVATKLRLLNIERAQPGEPTMFEHLPLAAPPRKRA